MIKKISTSDIAHLCAFRASGVALKDWSLDKKILRVEVTRAIKERRLNSKSHSIAHTNPWTREDHVERIAYLVINPDQKPISLTMNGSWVGDGNHRLASAIYRRDKYIEVDES